MGASLGSLCTRSLGAVARIEEALSARESLQRSSALQILVSGSFSSSVFETVVGVSPSSYGMMMLFRGGMMTGMVAARQPGAPLHLFAGSSGWPRLLASFILSG